MMMGNSGISSGLITLFQYLDPLSGNHANTTEKEKLSRQT